MKNYILLSLLLLFFLGCQTQKNTNQPEEKTNTEPTVELPMPEADSAGWYTIFDGSNIDSWKVGENANSFSIQDGTLKVAGPRGHLFYAGPLNDHNFTNFEFQAEVMTEPGANSGMYFHTLYQEEGWPSQGYEVQVNNSHTDWIRTASLYGIENLKEVPTVDNEWFTVHFKVEGKQITITLNGETVIDFTEPEGGNPENEDRFLSNGTFALQAHDPESVVYYRNIKVKPL